MSSASQILRDANLKVTLTRIKVIQVLSQSATQHLNAEEIHQLLLMSGDEINPRTLSRILFKFQAAKLVTCYCPRGCCALFKLTELG